MKRTQGIRLTWLVITVLYIGLIFFVSSRPYLRPPGPEFAMKDKVAHLLEYGVLGVLLCRAVGIALSRDRVVAVLALLAIVATLAACDEVFQSTIPGRVTDVRDWLADLTGAAIGASICLRRSRLRRGDSP
jgi:VanZ family protein